MSVLDTIVIGAGQSGLAAGYYLRRADQRFVMLEAGDEPTGSWSRYYKSLELFSTARYSSLPGMAFPGDPHHYPVRDEVVDYLRQYALQWSLPIETRARVERVERLDREGGMFRVTTTDGAVLQARSLVSAVGSYHHPHRPSFEGQADFGGRVMHSAEYVEPSSFRGRRVVVVGAGNSAVQIAVELAEVADVSIASRRAILWSPQELLGREIHFWWQVTGVDRFPLAAFPWKEPPQVLDRGLYRPAFDRGAVDRRPMFDRLIPGGVRWIDGTEEPVDDLLMATGFRPDLRFLASVPGALRGDGRVRHFAGIGAVPGMYFVGLPGQRTASSASLRGVGRDARAVTRHLLRHQAGTALSRLLPAPRVWDDRRLRAGVG